MDVEVPFSEPAATREKIDGYSLETFIDFITLSRNLKGKLHHEKTCFMHTSENKGADQLHGFCAADYLSLLSLH